MLVPTQKPALDRHFLRLLESHHSEVQQMFHAFVVWLHQFYANHSSPEWIAAFALLVQAGIFIAHALILHKHSEALEKTVEIANT